jgi:hypothetical protein
MRHEEYVDWLDRDESVELRKLAERKSYAVTDNIEATRNAVPEPVTVRVRTFIRPDESQAVRFVLDDGRPRTTRVGADAVGRKTAVPVQVDLPASPTGPTTRSRWSTTAASSPGGTGP